MAGRRKTKKPPFGIPREIILLTGDRGEWPFTFVADDEGGGCGKLPMPADATPDDVQAKVFAGLADLTRALHGVEIDVAWSALTPKSWVGRITPSNTVTMDPQE
ncbi:hypothetical protein [Streptomyces sp. NPDC051921]|uniref:hypothetical protein n=1 Tax=Streptomyces sp. NPDC051921 TaxID=3155806 RepID=UPI00342EBC64